MRPDIENHVLTEIASYQKMDDRRYYAINEAILSAPYITHEFIIHLEELLICELNEQQLQLSKMCI